MDVLALRPFDKACWAIRWIGLPPLKHACVDRLVDGGMRSIRLNIRLCADGPIQGRGNDGIRSLYKRVVGVNNARFHGVSVENDFRAERKSVCLRLTHHPAQRSLGKEVGLIASPDVSMGADEPTLLNVGNHARWRAA